MSTHLESQEIQKDGEPEASDMKFNKLSTWRTRWSTCSYSVDNFLEKSLPSLVIVEVALLLLIVPLVLINSYKIHQNGDKMALIETIDKQLVDIQTRLNDLSLKTTSSIINKSIPGQKGEPGLPGTTGLPGLSGRKGDPGERGEQGERGYPGAVGMIGSIGLTGPIGPKGEKGSDSGIVGPKGDKGDKGEQGEEGKSAPTPAGPFNFDLISASKGDEASFEVKCIGLCRDVNIRLSVESGDADLYAKEESVPKIENSNCDDCRLCKSRSSNLDDSCSGIQTQTRDGFFIKVTAHKPYVNGKLRINGFNLESATRVDQGQNNR